MEIWMMYALGGSLTIGIYSFLQKIESESKINRNSFILYSHVWMIIYPLLYLLSTWGKIEFNMQIFLYALLINTIYVTVMKFRLKSLEYLDSSSYFINYRIFSSILLLIFWQIFFWEIISIKEYIWIFLGFIIFYLLLEKKYKNESEDNLYKGFIYLGIGVIWVSVMWIIQKQFILLDLDFASYILFSWITGSLVTLWFKGNKNTLKEVIKVKNNKQILFLLLCWTIFPLWMFFNLNAVYQWWDVAIVYKIVSYSLFIPIILSVIFYNEKITVKKLLAFILTIASIGLFV
jgi:drug/metabolite transporter (DMT)-like permease